jgi:hypothetical protein
VKSGEDSAARELLKTLKGNWALKDKVLEFFDRVDWKLDKLEFVDQIYSRSKASIHLLSKHSRPSIKSPKPDQSTEQLLMNSRPNSKASTPSYSRYNETLKPKWKLSYIQSINSP